MTKHLEEELEAAVANEGLVELKLRVSRFEKDLVTPAAWQAIAVYRNAPKGPWRIGVRSNPVAAVRAALLGAKEPVSDIEGDVFS